MKPPGARVGVPLPYLRSRWAAFTLLEIMIVVGIMGIMVTIGVPIVYRAWKRAPMAKALSELVEVCSRARAVAIMQGKPVELVFYPQEGRFGISGGTIAGAGPRIPLAGPISGSGDSGQLPPEVTIQLLDINKLWHPFERDESARVRFFPNGTCDEMTLVLMSDRGEQRAVTLEVTTSLASVINDPSKLLNRR